MVLPVQDSRGFGVSLLADLKNGRVSRTEEVEEVEEWGHESASMQVDKLPKSPSLCLYLGSAARSNW